ncbi:MAG TPA: hypothetical protein VHN99_11885 [Deinococcales bacterium]|nr:hypothetical protein [Deinococcales bacterium]
MTRPWTPCHDCRWWLALDANRQAGECHRDDAWPATAREDGCRDAWPQPRETRHSTVTNP